MKIRQILHAAVFFLLPGMTAGWLLAAGALRFFDDPAVTGVIFAGAALAGALTGRYLSARKLLAGAGLLCLLALPVFRMHGLFPAVSFALGVFAIQPVRPVHRRFFQVGVWLTVSLGLLAGGAYLVNMYLAKIALSLLLPAISTLGAGKTFRRVTGTLFFLAGLILLLLPWTTPAAITLPRGETAAFWQSGDSAMLRLGNRIYRLPEDMDRQKPDLLIAALQVQTGNPCALV
ncbi:MAG: hypothetical protein J6S73_00020, partial [Lentisphaeria bacterium]|nr:hypothetical protein [Lentisphaeria bacterium]